MSLFINKNIVCKLHFSYGYLFSIFLTFISYSAKINKFSAKYYFIFVLFICFSFNLTKIYLPTELYNVTTFSIKSIKKLLFWVFSALPLIVSWAYICHKHTLSKKKSLFTRDYIGASLKSSLKIEQCTECGNNKNLLSHIIDKNYVKITFEITKVFVFFLIFQVPLLQTYDSI